MAFSFRCEGSLPPVLASKVPIPSCDQGFITCTPTITCKASIVIRRSGNGPTQDQLGTGLQAIQLSPHHAGLAEQHLLRLLCAFRFSAMLLFPSLSASGKAADLWDVPSIPILWLRDTVRVVAAHRSFIIVAIIAVLWHMLKSRHGKQRRNRPCLAGHFLL